MKKNITFFLLLLIISVGAALGLVSYAYNVNESIPFFVALDFYILILLCFNCGIYGMPSMFNPFFFFLVGAFVFIGLPPFIVDFPAINSPKIRLVILTTFMGVTAFAIGWLTFRKKTLLNFSKKRELGRLRYEYFPKGRRENVVYVTLLICFLVGLILQDIILRQTENSNIFRKILNLRSPGDTDSVVGIWTSFYRFPFMLSYALITGSSLILMFLVIYDFSRKRIYKVLGWSTFILSVVINFGTGGRMRFFATCFPVFLIYVYRGSFFKIKIRNVGKILIRGAVVVILIFVTINLMTKYRNAGLRGFFEDKDREIVDITTTTRFGFNQIPDFLRVFYTFPDRRDYLYGSTIFGVLVNPIPREWYPGKKPVGIGAIMGDINLAASSGKSVSVTIFGELYANFWFFGVFWGLLIFGLLLKKWFLWFNRNTDDMKAFILYIHSLPFVTIEVRGGFLEWTMSYVIQLVALLIMLKLINLNPKRKPKLNAQGFNPKQSGLG